MLATRLSSEGGSRPFLLELLRLWKRGLRYRVKRERLLRRTLRRARRVPGNTHAARRWDLSPLHRRDPVSRERHPATSAARAGLGNPTTTSGVDLVAPPAVSSVRAYPDLVAWAEQADVLDASAAERLRADAARRPAATEAAFERAVALGEAIYGILGATRRGEPPRARVMFASTRLWSGLTQTTLG